MAFAGIIAQQLGSKKVGSIAFIFSGNGTTVNISGKDDKVSVFVYFSVYCTDTNFVQHTFIIFSI